MTNLDIYDETENLISSDEYSEDDLMNTAISSQNIMQLDTVESVIAKASCNDKKIKLNVKRKSIINLYKKKSIKWLNGKKHREKYRKYLFDMVSKIKDNSKIPKEVEEEVDKSIVILKANQNLPRIINLDDTSQEQTESIINVSDVKFMAHKEEVQVDSGDSKNTKQLEQNNKAQQTMESKNSTFLNTNTCETMETEFSDTNNISKEDDKDKTSKIPLYNEINDMFSKYDVVISKHVKTTNINLQAVEENVTRVLIELQTINDILHTKETEWNKLLHLKRVKEEILTRLVRKKHILELQSSQIDESKYNMLELKEREMYLSEYNKFPDRQPLRSTVQKLIESRANMKTEDLEKEKTNTNRLKNILVSSNIFRKTIDLNNHVTNKNNSVQHNSTSMNPKQAFESLQYLEKRLNGDIGRQGLLTDVRSLIADFRQKDNGNLTHDKKRFKINESNYIKTNHSNNTCASNKVRNNSCVESNHTFGNINSSTLEKLLSNSSQLHDSPQLTRSNAYSQGLKLNIGEQNNVDGNGTQNNSINSCHEISIIPVLNENQIKRDHEYKPELLRSALNIKTRQNPFNEDKMKFEMSKTFKCRNVINQNEIPICQECKSSESRFVCGGCGSQWYCSRKCQISAWDKHSETCNE